MGRMMAEGFVEVAGLEGGLAAHLDANFFPPLPAYVKVGIVEAFKDYWKNGSEDSDLDELASKCYLKNRDALFRYFSSFLIHTEGC
jgi:hypothetical protein